MINVYTTDADKVIVQTKGNGAQLALESMLALDSLWVRFALSAELRNILLDAVQSWAEDPDEYAKESGWRD